MSVRKRRPFAAHHDKNCFWKTVFSLSSVAGDRCCFSLSSRKESTACATVMPSGSKSFTSSPRAARSKLSLMARAFSSASDHFVVLADCRKGLPFWCQYSHFGQSHFFHARSERCEQAARCRV